MSSYSQAANDLHRCLLQTHWNGSGLYGPDPGIRINYRIGRFVKSYLRLFQWNDSLCYVQGQGYWILANWLKFRQTGDPMYRLIAVSCSQLLLQRQLDEGAWEYPNPEWRGRIATAEGSWAAIALIESYRQTQNPVFLDGVLRWRDFLVHRIGFKPLNAKMAKCSWPLIISLIERVRGSPTIRRLSCDFSQSCIP